MFGKKPPTGTSTGTPTSNVNGLLNPAPPFRGLTYEAKSDAYLDGDGRLINKHAMDALRYGMHSGEFDKMLKHASLAQTNTSPFSERQVHARDLKSMRIDQMADKLLAELPGQVIAQLGALVFKERIDNKTGKHVKFYVVLEVSDRQIAFDNIGDFPTEADISRIVLECP